MSVVNSPQEAADRPSLSALPLAFGLAFLAGATDVYGLARLNDLYVSFMSGNTTMPGVALGRGDWARVQVAAGLIGLFVAGVAGGAALEVLTGRNQTAVVTLAVAVVLAVPLWEPRSTIVALVLAMGCLNAAMNRAGPASISLTYVTGTLVKLGQGLGRTLCGRRDGWGWLLQAPMWLSLLAGAVCAVLSHRWLGSEALWPLPASALLLALAAAMGQPGASSTTTPAARGQDLAPAGRTPNAVHEQG